MKKIRITLLGLLLTLGGPSFAQDYIPTSKWPYLYESFSEGNVLTSNAMKLQGMPMNICIANGALHYFDSGIIKEADMSNITTVTIGHETFLNIGKKLYKILYCNDKGFILEQTTVDTEAQSKTSIGYGIESSTAQAQNNVSMLMDMSSDLLNMDTLSATARKGEGEELPLKMKKYFYFNQQLVQAKESEAVKINGIDKKDLQSFVKTNKYKWNKLESLEKILGYIEEHQK